MSKTYEEIAKDCGLTIFKFTKVFTAGTFNGSRYNGTIALPDKFSFMKWVDCINEYYKNNTSAYYYIEID